MTLPQLLAALAAWTAAALIVGAAIGTATHLYQGWECRRCGRLNKSEDTRCRECGALAYPDQAERDRAARLARHAAAAITKGPKI